MYLFKGSRTQKLFPRLSKKNIEKRRKSKSYNINKTSRKLRARLSTSRKNDQAVDYRGVSRETRQAFAVLPCVCLFIKKKKKKRKKGNVKTHVVRRMCSLLEFVEIHYIYIHFCFVKLVCKDLRFNKRKKNR